MTATATCDPLDAYEATAPIYDLFTAHHDYDAWTETIEALARTHGLRACGSLLDVGCGTGKSFLPWLARGWSVVGCDRSPGMLERARGKAPDAHLLVADARHLPPLGPFDLVLALDDVVNYVDAGDHPSLFASLAANLAPDGVLVFDLNTLATFRSFFATTAVVEHDGLVAVWRGTTPPDLPPAGTADAILDAFVEEGGATWRRLRAHHREHHHPLRRVERALAEAGLTIAGAYGQDAGGDAEPGVDELRHTKALVVARHR